MKIVNRVEFKKDSFIILISIVFGLIFFFVDSFGVLNFFRNGVSYVMEPVSLLGESVGSSGSTYLKTFFKLGQFTKEYNDMKILLTEKDIQISSYIELESENEALRKQMELKNYKEKYVLASVLSSSDSEHIRIDQGSKSGVNIGDIVSIGNLFIGIVDYVDLNSSLVKLPSSGNSYLQVVILKTQEGKDFGTYIKNRVISKGVLNGTNKGIMVENISMESSVEDGDIIFVNDSKVNDFLVVGYVVGITSNPASISRSCFVSTIVDYDQLTKVFVRVE